MRARSIYFVLVLMLSPCLWAQAANPQAGALPEDRAAAFYRFYLHALGEHQFPLDDPHGPIRQFVAAPLMRELARKAKSPDGLGSDYFLRAQDWPDDWSTHVQTTRVKTGGPNATALVLLGTGERRHSLRVLLAKEGGVWKIRRVSAG